MRKVRVDGERFLNAELLHYDKAQTIHNAVRLVLVLLEVLEGRSFFIRSGPVDARELFVVQLAAKPDRLVVADLECQRDCFGDDMIRRQQAIGEPNILEFLEDFDDALMMCVLPRDEREEESRVEKDHAFGWPYR